MDSLADEELTPFCPYYKRASEIIGGRWTAAIIRVLLSGVVHFNEIASAIPGLSDRLLSQRLKELEAEGIVLRTVVPDTPVRIEYALSDKGRDLASVVKALSDWAARWVEHDQPAVDG
ncbi:MAG: helix-turn-helix transcriptional regulator [Actinobacteria bacterium]|jgi:DNA-binding HxlR family transcriptional regulator|nr:helix-turn-helix transcriptional regulator [Actinomycetota bacterium]